MNEYIQNNNPNIFIILLNAVGKFINCWAMKLFLNKPTHSKLAEKDLFGRYIKKLKLKSSYFEH